MSSSAGIIIIGDEILSGRTKDTNINWIANELNEIGIPEYIAKQITYPEIVTEKNKSFLYKCIENENINYPGAVGIIIKSLNKTIKKNI